MMYQMVMHNPTANTTHNMICNGLVRPIISFAAFMRAVALIAAAVAAAVAALVAALVAVLVAALVPMTFISVSVEDIIQMQ